jgi:restriction system protein
MAIPDYQTMMLPFLKELGDGKEHALSSVRESLASQFSLAAEEREELLPSGNQTVYENRIGWARTYLKMAGLLEYVKRGVFRITDRGQEVLANPPAAIDIKYLDQFPEFQEFRNKKKKDKTEKVDANDLYETPDEVIEASYQQLRDELTTELLDQIQAMSWRFFERLVIELLLEMGYGGSRKEAGEAFQRGSDEGIDGIIKEDRLGLDIIYVQAKRWKDGSTVGRPEIQKFAGALQGKRARKGVFITTSDFSKEAFEYAGMIDSKIILIGGSRLAELMMEHGVGVATTRSYEIKRIDLDYFTEE